jgi:hypothetical protein
MSSGSSVSGSGAVSGSPAGSTSDQQLERAVQAYRECLKR